VLQWGLTALAQRCSNRPDLDGSGLKKQGQQQCPLNALPGRMFYVHNLEVITN